MSNNKLKNMIENHELDDFVNNEDLKEKLCELQTSEEVLELLKKYNYHESKEVFEVELMDLLKEFVDEEELLKVSGGKNNKKSFSNIITSLAVAGSLCMPVQGVTGVQQKEKREDKKSSYSIRLPKKEEVGLGVAVTTGIVGVGVILGKVLRRNILTRKDGNVDNNDNETKDQISRDMTPELYEEMHEHFMKIATRPQECNPGDFKKYTLRELADYMFEELIHWFKYMEKYHIIDEENVYKIGSKAVNDGRYTADFVCCWNRCLEFLVCVYLASISLSARLETVTERELQVYLTYLSNSDNRIALHKVKIEPQTWVIDTGKLKMLEVNEKNERLMIARIVVDDYGLDEVLSRAIFAYVTDWGNANQREKKTKVSVERMNTMENRLKEVTMYMDSAYYKSLRDQLITEPCSAHSGGEIAWWEKVYRY